MLTARANIASTSAFTASSARATTAKSRGALVVTAASKKKDVRLQVTLECTEQKESGIAGMSRYMTQKVGFVASTGWV
jgi:large subunit ribosomal protein L33